MNKKGDVGYIGAQHKHTSAGQVLFDCLGGKIFMIKSGARLFLSNGGRDLSFRYPFWVGTTGTNHCRITPEPGRYEFETPEQAFFQVTFRHISSNRTTIIAVRTWVPLIRVRDVFREIVGV